MLAAGRPGGRWVGDIPATARGGDEGRCPPVVEVAGEHWDRHPAKVGHLLRARWIAASALAS